MRRNADLWEIDQLEKNFHKATTLQDIDLMMSLYAPNATFTFPGSTAVGKKEISAVLAHQGEVVQPNRLDLRDARRTRSGSRSTATAARCTSSAHYVDAEDGQGRGTSRPPTWTSRGSTDAG